MRLKASQLRLQYGTTVVAPDLSVTIPDGRISAVIGPNGSGKSTLLRALARLLAPRAGEVLLDGKEVGSYSTKEVARRLAILPQILVSPESITVEELVAFGRFPQRRTITGLRDDDRRAIDWALEVTNMDGLRTRPVDQLSGGQRQSAWIALVLAQGTDLILLDEPTTFLDVAHQLEVLDLLRRLNAEEGKTIVMILHDINSACACAHWLFALRDGAVVAEGPPSEILTRELVLNVFGVDAHIIDHPSSHTPLCVPFRLGLTREGLPHSDSLVLD